MKIAHYSSNLTLPFISFEQIFPELQKAIDDAGGAAQQMADTQLDKLGGSVTLLKSALEGAGIAIGNTLAPMLRTLAEWLTNAVSAFNKRNLLFDVDKM